MNTPTNSTRICIAVLFLICVTASSTAYADSLEKLFVFGHQYALAKGRLETVAKWDRVVKEETSFPTFTPEGLKKLNLPIVKEWEALREKIKDSAVSDQLKVVNVFFNRWPARTDSEVWQKEDYWATPAEFFAHSGDTEDYAIVKYYALKALGIPADNMRIAVVVNTVRDVGHAILLVKDQGDILVLDNLSNLVLPSEKFLHYRPRYIVNEEGIWQMIDKK